MTLLWVGVDYTKCPGIEAGSALIVDTSLNDLFGQMLLHGGNPIDFADALRERVMKAMYHFGTAKDTIESPVAGEMKEILLDDKGTDLR